MAKKRKSNSKIKTLIILGAISLVLLSLVIILVLKVSRRERAYYEEAQKHIQLAETEKQFQIENGLLSSRDSVPGKEAGKILTGYESVAQTATVSSWGGKSFLSFATDGAEDDDLLILEFVAQTEGKNSISLEVGYDNFKTLVEVNERENAYYIPYYGISGKRTVSMIFFSEEGDTDKIIFSSIRLVDYGKNRTIGELKTGQYLLEDYEKEDVPVSEVSLKATSAVESGEYLYTIFNGKLSVNRKEGDTLTEVGSLTGLGDTFDLCLSEEKNLLLVTSKGSGVFFVDINSPEKPSLLSSYGTLGHCYGADVYGNYAFLCNRYYGVEVVDFSNPSAPYFVTKLQNENLTEYKDCKVGNGYLYVSGYRERKLDIYDIRTLSDLSLVASADLDGYGSGIDYKDGFLYVSTIGDSGLFGINEKGMRYDVGNGTGVEVIDVRTPQNPVMCTRFKIDGRMSNYAQEEADAYVSGDTLYVSSERGGLYIYDITRPDQPIRKKVLNYVAGADSELFLEEKNTATVMPYDYTKETHGSIMHLAAGDLGVFAITSDMGIIEIPGVSAGKAAAEDKTEILAGEKQKAQETVFEGQKLEVYQNIGTVYSLAGFDKNRIAVACGNGGIAIADGKMNVLSSLKTGYCVKDIRVSNNLIYTAENNGGLAIYQYEDGALSEVGRVTDRKADVWYDSLEISEDGSFAVVQAGYRLYRIVDLSDVSNPVVLESPADVGTGKTFGRNVCIGKPAGKYVGISGVNLTLWFYRDQNGSGSVEESLRFIKNEDGISEMEWSGMAAYGNDCILTKDGGFCIFDPESGVKKCETAIQDDYINGKCATSGNLLVVSRSVDGKISVLDISNPENPSVLMKIDTDYFADAPRVIDGSVYIPLRHDGVMKII